MGRIHRAADRAGDLGNGRHTGITEASPDLAIYNTDTVIIFYLDHLESMG